MRKISCDLYRNKQVNNKDKNLLQTKQSQKTSKKGRRATSGGSTTGVSGAIKRQGVIIPPFWNFPLKGNARKKVIHLQKELLKEGTASARMMVAFWEDSCTNFPLAFSLRPTKRFWKHCSKYRTICRTKRVKKNTAQSTDSYCGLSRLQRFTMQNTTQ